MRRLQILVVFLLAVVLALGACAPKAPPPPAAPAAPAALTEWERVVEAAKKEGVITVYNGLSKAVALEVREGFMKQYPEISVEMMGLRGAAIIERIRMEQQTGAYACDVILSGYTTPQRAAGDGFAEPIAIELPALKEKGVWRVDPYLYAPKKDGLLLMQNVRPDAMINTEMVKEGEVTSWNDLLDPKWKGKMVITDPRGPGPGSMGLYAAMELGEDYWSKMVRQDILLLKSYGAVIDAVALGEKPLAIFASFSRTKIATEAGAPIKMVHLKEGSQVVNKGACVIKNAPHPNAALLLLNWLLTKEGQLASSKAQGVPTLRNDIVEDWVTIPELRHGAWHKVFTRIADAITLQEAQDFAISLWGK